MPRFGVKYLLVVVVLSAIKETIASFDGVDDLVGSSVDIHFPSTIRFTPEKGPHNPKPTWGISALVGLSLSVGAVTVIVPFSCSCGLILSSGSFSDYMPPHSPWGLVFSDVARVGLT